MFIISNINLYWIIYIIKRVVRSPYFKVHTRTEIFRKISYFRSKHKRLFEKEIKTIFNDISKDQLEKSIACNPN